MTSDEVEALVRKRTHSTIPVYLIEECEGDSVSFLSYSIDDRKQLTIWHTEVPTVMQHNGVGRRLVEKALELAHEDGGTLRIVCPFAKDYLAKHPELKERNSVVKDAVTETESLF